MQSPDDMADARDAEAAALRLRRSYSTCPPAELRRRVDARLRQVRRLLAGESRRSVRSELLAAASWLTLLRGTVLLDLEDFEAAETSVRTARELAAEIGHREVEAWTWETAAWIAATGDRQQDARDLATIGMEIAPRGGHALVAVTLQRARIQGALADERAASRDLGAGERAWSAAGDPGWRNDHYQLDRAKVAFFGSGVMAGLRRPRETIELASEVVRANGDPRARCWRPTRVANARLELAMARADLGDEDEAAAIAGIALDPRWLRPDTERRARLLLLRMRDQRLREQVSERLRESRAAAGRGLRSTRLGAG